MALDSATEISISKYIVTIVTCCSFVAGILVLTPNNSYQDRHFTTGVILIIFAIVGIVANIVGSEYILIGYMICFIIALLCILIKYICFKTKPITNPATEEITDSIAEAIECSSSTGGYHANIPFVIVV